MTADRQAPSPASDDQPAESSPPAPSVEEWLPPRYVNPESAPALRGAANRDSEAPFVMLPGAEGGFEPVNNRIVHIEHQGRQIPLVVLPRGQRLRRRIMFNVICAVLSLAILALVFWWLTRGQ